MEKLIRKKLRLNNFDYSTQGYYFVTICTHNKTKIFGEVNELNDMGQIAKEEIELISERLDGVSVDKYIVMPNHIHAIIVIGCENIKEKLTPELYFNPPKFMGLEQIIQLYKSGVTRRIHREVDEKIIIWQKSYYDVILDTKKKYDNAWYYIENNPIEEKIRKSEFGFLGND